MAKEPTTRISKHHQMKYPMNQEDIIESLEKRIAQLEQAIREISTLNSLGKTLKINEIIIKALNE